MRLALVLLLLASALVAQEQPVLVLGKTQLLGDAAAFEAFCRKHDKTSRSALRKQVVKRLKAIAAKEQPTILKAVGDPAARSLWLVNAVVVSLDAKGIEGADALVVVEIPPDANAGESSVATLTATSQGDPSVSASSLLTTTVPVACDDVAITELASDSPATERL